MLQLDAIEIKKQKKLGVVWSVTFMIVFPLLVVLGLLMRLNQGTEINLSQNTFYALMTLHGLGMAGTLFSFSFAALWYLNSTRYARMNIKVGYFVYIAILIGVIGLAIATLIGKFGPGWYVLYPLPFIGMGQWMNWSLGLAIVSLIILGVAWLIGIVHMIYALGKEYGPISNLLGWQYLKKKEVKKDMPPIVMITTISLVPGLFAMIVGAAMLIAYLLQFFEPSLSFDPLLMKNMVMFFGHTLVNITMYCCVGWVYALLPEFTGRAWKMNKVLVYSWNATFFFILFAYFHHLYMDFAQPRSMQYIGQFISYGSAVPATAITMFSVIAQLYHSKIKWNIIPLAFLFGTAGWAIGGVAAVVDSTISINKILHNTLWVPAHFHTYMLMGVVLFILGFLFYFFSSKEFEYKNAIVKTGFWAFVIGGYGFLLMFYLGGMNSVPRRYDSYSGISAQNTHDTAVHLSQYAALFIYLLLIGLLIMYVALMARVKRRTAV